MKNIILLFLLSVIFLIPMRLLAQKKIVDLNDFYFKREKQATAAVVTGDGTYIGTSMAIPDSDRSVWQLSSIRGKWKKQIDSCRNLNPALAMRDRLFLVLTRSDTLRLITLGGDHAASISHVANFSVDPNNDNWLAFQPDTGNGQLVIRNLKTGSERRFDGISNYQFTGSSSAVLQQAIGKEQTRLLWLDLALQKIDTIWQGDIAKNLIFSALGDALAFIGSRPEEKLSILYYRRSMVSAEKVVNSDSLSSAAIDITGLRSFNSSGDRFFFNSVKKTAIIKPDSKLSSVDVYSYKDPMLQSKQLKLLNGSTGAIWVYHIPAKKQIQLTDSNEILVSKTDDQKPLNYLLVKKTGKGDLSDEYNWNPEARDSIFLVSTLDGTRKCVAANIPEAIAGTFNLSPLGKYVIYYDTALNDYCSYKVADGTTHDITKGVPAQWIDKYYCDFPDTLQGFCGIAGWLKDDAGVLMKSRTDIFQIDPDGKQQIINLTGGFGSKNQVLFQCLTAGNNSLENIDPGHTLLLQAFDQKTKDISFCKVLPGKGNEINIQKWFPYCADVIVKAKNAAMFLVQFESAEFAPNWVLSGDLKTVRQLTDVQPQKQYNWLTSELINYPTLDGSMSQGILYKPENFDPTRKYPVIFQYYERMSDDLHRFPRPENEGGGHINIAKYVSSGYLVFLPDIWYQVGFPGRSAYNSIVGAARFLGHYNWVDTLHMGLRGQSFGGFETNYVIAHSHLFAAAVSSSGMSDFVSAYGSITFPSGKGRQGQYEHHRDRIGATLWQNPQLYLENSPVLLADQVTTPVLMMCNHNDEDVPAEQGFEFFTALRRLQKKAWLLQYDKGGHALYNNYSAEDKDFSMRQQQFFDHYLKGMPPPKWMTAGVPTATKQVDAGFAIDRTGAKP